MIICYNIYAQAVVQLCFVGGLLMQHFSKQLRTRLLTLYLSAGLVMGGLPGCGSQDLEIADTVAESAVTATADATDVTTFSQPEGPEESTIYVEPVDGISDDFYRGMDVSAVLALENSGVKYYNFDGEEQDVFMTLAQAGVNYIRLRVWNDPYDENGNGYGGGNNDVATAITLGQRATQYGMKVCIDFHYSDFWADPKKQFVPKAWEGMDIEEKSDALYNFTLENLTQILDAGVDVGMVQVGNEINNGMCGETDASNVRKLLASGSKAVRDAATASGKDILVVDAGTCITYEFIDAAGRYHGGNISPGVQMRFKALHEFTGRLPLVVREGRRLPLGKDTDTAMREGVLKGMEYEISGYITTMKHKYPELLVFLTGGDDFSFDTNLKSIIFADRFLVLKGFNRILNYNNDRI